MKQILLSMLTCGIYVSTFAQIDTSGINRENSAKWVNTPAKNLKGELGQLDMNFPAGLDWNIGNLSITRESDNKYITSFSGTALKTKKFYNLEPGEYRISLNNLPVEHVTIQKGQVTKLKVGILNVTATDRWEIYNESKKKYLTSYNKPLRFVAPVGKYILSVDGQDQVIEVIDEAFGQEKPQIIDSAKWVITPLPDTAVVIKGRLNFGLTTYDYFSPGEGYEFRPGIFNESGDAVMHSCPGQYGLCTHTIYLDQGKYSVAATWADPYGSIDPTSPIRILNVPVKKGSETRIKIGFLRNLTKGDFELLDEKKELVYWQYMNRGNTKRPLPVGKYVIRQPGIGVFPIEIEDGKEFSLNTIQGYSSQKMDVTYRIFPINSITLNREMGRLNCKFPGADTTLFNLKMPNTNGGLTTISLDTLKYLDLMPGKYELYFGTLTIPFQIEKQKETRIIHGFIFLRGERFFDPVRGGSFGTIYNSVNGAIPVRPGFYYIDLGGSPTRLFLIKVREGETVDYKQYKLIPE